MRYELIKNLRNDENVCKKAKQITTNENQTNKKREYNEFEKQKKDEK
jgi:hypothetical protein